MESNESTCNWQGIEDYPTALASLRGTISIISFELTEDSLNLDRIAMLAESIIAGTKRVEELT